MGSVQFSVIKHKNARMCGDIHNSVTKIKLVLNMICWNCQTCQKNKDNDKIILFIMWWSIKHHGQREFRGLDSTPFVETVEKKALENLKFCETGQLGRIIPWPKYACEVDCCIFWYPCFRWLRWWWFAPQWNISFIRWPGLNQWGLSYRHTTT